MRFLYPVALVSLVACGTADRDRPANSGSQGPSEPPTTDTQAASEPGDQSAPTPYSMALDNAAALPACDDVHDHQLVYLITEKVFQTCQTGAWTVVEVAAPATLAPAEIKNRLATISLGDKFADLLPEVREVLLGAQATNEKEPASQDYCNPKLAGTEYSVNLKDYGFNIEVRNGLVDVICEDPKGDAHPQCETTPCTDR